jgi:hypothetical protein
MDLTKRSVSFCTSPSTIVQLILAQSAGRFEFLRFVDGSAPIVRTRTRASSAIFPSARTSSFRAPLKAPESASE